MTDPYVHPTAVVENGAILGAGARVWHHAHVRAGARIGAGTNLGKNVFVDSGAVIGDRVKVQNNVSVYTGVTVGDDVFVGPSAVFTNDLVPRAFAEDWVVTPTIVGHGAVHWRERDDRVRQRHRRVRHGRRRIGGHPVRPPAPAGGRQPGTSRRLGRPARPRRVPRRRASTGGAARTLSGPGR